MKRAERHHLKADPLAARLRPMLESVRGGRWVAAAAIGLGVLVAGASVFGWQQWRASRASELLAAAMAIVDAPVVPADAGSAAAGAPEGAYPSEAAKLETAVPRLLEAADAYPSLPQGIAARYHAAAALGALGRTAEAGEQYERLIELAGDGLYGRMARLGRAEEHLQAGEHDRAIALLEAETRIADAEFPVDAVLLRLGQSYRLAGRTDEARTTFQRLVDEHPASGYRFDAEQELDTLSVAR